MLLVLRIFLYVVVILIGASFAAYLFTRDRRFLRFAWQAFKYALILAAVVLLLFALERVATML
ncbi:MAG TPA: hypothetical protein VKC64_11395 [Burkholderiales bacterium]|nr:hypothetical protein [Burkholderiales bacterium]